MTADLRARRWLLLVLALIMSFGGGLAVTLLIVHRQASEAQRDLCDLVRAFDDTEAEPVTEWGRDQAEAVRAYRAARC